MLHALGGSIVEISQQAKHADKSTTLNEFSYLFQEEINLKKKTPRRSSKGFSRQKEKRTDETS